MILISTHAWPSGVWYVWYHLHLTEAVFKSSHFEIAGPKIRGVTLIVLALWLLSFWLSCLYFPIGFKSSLGAKPKIEDEVLASIGPNFVTKHPYEAWRALLNGTGDTSTGLPHRVEMIIWAFAGLKSGRWRPAAVKKRPDFGWYHRWIRIDEIYRSSAHYIYVTINNYQ